VLGGRNFYNRKTVMSVGPSMQSANVPTVLDVVEGLAMSFGVKYPAPPRRREIQI